MKILLPMDIVNPPELIIEYLEQILPLQDKSVHLLYVNEAWPAYESVIQSSGQFPDDWRQKIDAHALEELAAAASKLAGKCIAVDSEVVSGPPAMMIETVARDENCQITVLCPGKHDLMDRILLGSVSAKVLKHGPGTILICRPTEKPVERLKQVVIGVDGSANAKDALRSAVEMFKLNESSAKVLLVHSVDIADPVKFLSPVEFISAIEQNLLMEGESILADGKRILSDLGVKNIDLALVEGKPQNQIIKTAESVRADLIIIGAEGKTAIQHFLLGSVSQKVARYAPCAVAVVKRTHTPTDN